ncbi:MAG: hypothetical protein AAF243_14280, partial [Cyanobacteria bacterium P01_A01_bin.137]
MKYTPREIVDEVNVTPVHPLVNFGYLIGTVVAASVTLYAGLEVAGAQIAARIGLAAEHGTDGTAQRGGDLGYFVKADMVQPFAE